MSFQCALLSYPEGLIMGGGQYVKRVKSVAKNVLPGQNDLNNNNEVVSWGIWSGTPNKSPLFPQRSISLL